MALPVEKAEVSALVLCKWELFYQTAEGKTIKTEYPHNYESAERIAKEYSGEWLSPKTGLSRDLCLRMLEVAVRGLRMARRQEAKRLHRYPVRRTRSGRVAWKWLPYAAKNAAQRVFDKVRILDA